jgi:hypothetical protein
MLAIIGKKGTLTHWWWECKLVQPLSKSRFRLLKKTKPKSAVWSMVLPYVIPLLGVHLKECDSN